MDLRELPKFFTVAEVATILACSTKHVGRLIKAGRLRAVDIGTGRTRELRVSAAALDALDQAPTSSASTTSGGGPSRRRGRHVRTVTVPGLTLLPSSMA